MTIKRHLRRALGADERGPLPLGRFLLFLLAVDALVILLHLAYKTSDNLFGVLLPVHFDMLQDGSFGEQVQYLGAFGVAVLCGALFVRTWQPAYLAWSATFVYLLADDALRLHEEFAKLLIERWRLQAWLGLRPQDVGELAVVAMSASAVLALVGLGHHYSDHATRAFSRRLFAVLIGLGFFGVAIDLLPAGSFSFVVGSLLAVVEDGGELVVMSLALWLARWQDLALAD